MTAEAYCPICLNHFPIDADKPEFVIFPCGTSTYVTIILTPLNSRNPFQQHLTGHGFCEGCTNRLFSSGARTRCPNCRKFINQRDGHPVYLQLIDSGSALATKVTEGFGQMNTDTPLVSLKKASIKLGQVVKGNPDRSTIVSALFYILKRTPSEISIQTVTPFESNRRLQ